MNLVKKKHKADLKAERWKIEKLILKQNQQISKEKYELKTKIWENKIPFAKMLMIFLFINFTLLELFTGWITLKSFSLAREINMMPDFTPLITLLGAVVGETLSYGIYSAKAKAENTKNGIVYETTMKELEQQEECQG